MTIFVVGFEGGDDKTAPLTYGCAALLCDRTKVVFNSILKSQTPWDRFEEICADGHATRITPYPLLGQGTPENSMVVRRHKVFVLRTKLRGRAADIMLGFFAAQRTNLLEWWNDCLAESRYFAFTSYEGMEPALKPCAQQIRRVLDLYPEDREELELAADILDPEPSIQRLREMAARDKEKSRE